MAEDLPRGRLLLRGGALVALALGAAVGGGLILFQVCDVVIRSFAPASPGAPGGSSPPGLRR